MLDTPRAIQGCFTKCLSRAEAVNLAVAWARPGWALDQLIEAKLPVCALIGTAFDMTHPDALEALMKMGDSTQVSEGTDALFHPKVYIFQRRGACDAMIGSVNLTGGAFLANREAAVHLRLEQEEANSWLAAIQRWGEGARKVTPRWLAAYRRTWKPPKSGPIRAVCAAEDLESAPAVPVPGGIKLHELRAAGWDSYERALRKAAATRFTVDALADEGPTYQATLRVTRRIMSGPLPQRGTPEFLQLLGAATAGSIHDCGWFGRLTANGIARRELGTNTRLRKDIERILPEVRAAHTDDEAHKAAMDMFAAVTRWERLRAAVVSRLLTLTRPDRYFSLNGASEVGISKLLDIPMSRLHTAEGYSRALRTFWDTPWYRSPGPMSRGSRELWEARVALIDAIVYVPRNS